MRRRRMRRAPAAVVLLITVALGACGSSNEPKVLGEEIERSTTSVTTSGDVATPATGAVTTSTVVGAPTTSPATTAVPRPTTTTLPPGTVAVTVLRSPTAGQFVDLDVRVDGAHQPYLVTLDFGDGQTMQLDGAGSMRNPPAMDCAPTTPLHQVVRHAWRAAVRYRVTATASFCHEPSVVSTVDVTPHAAAQAVPSNGPEPAAYEAPVGVAESPDPSDYYLRGFVVEPDGWLGRISIDWGDGGPPEILQDGAPSGCTDSAQRWPSSRFTLDHHHRYAGARPDAVRLTVASAGCDGQAGQLQTIVVQVRPTARAPA